MQALIQALNSRGLENGTTFNHFVIAYFFPFTAIHIVSSAPKRFHIVPLSCKVAVTESCHINQVRNCRIHMETREKANSQSYLSIVLEILFKYVMAIVGHAMTKQWRPRNGRCD